MALGTPTVVTKDHKSSSAPLKFFHLTFAGDGAYPGGGTASFESFVRTAVGEAVDVLWVQRAGACGGYTPVYDKANDKLYLEYYDYDAVADGVGIENAVADVSGVTMSIIVACQ